jgi:Tfp pilus assembly protein PilF
LDEAIRLDPKNPNSYRNRSFVYDSKGDFDHAIADLDEAIRLQMQCLQEQGRDCTDVPYH